MFRGTTIIVVRKDSQTAIAEMDKLLVTKYHYEA